MTKHNTRSKVTSDRLEEVILRLTQTQPPSPLTNMNFPSKSIPFSSNWTLVAPHSAHPLPSPYINRSLIMLEVPRFDGNDVMGWIFKISQFFDYQGTPDEDRIIVTSLYMDGLLWVGFNGCFATASSRRGLACSKLTKPDLRRHSMMTAKEPCSNLLNVVLPMIIWMSLNVWKIALLASLLRSSLVASSPDSHQTFAEKFKHYNLCLFLKPWPWQNSTKTRLRIAVTVTRVKLLHLRLPQPPTLPQPHFSPPHPKSNFVSWA